LYGGEVKTTSNALSGMVFITSKQHPFINLFIVLVSVFKFIVLS